MLKTLDCTKNQGFTILELLIVVVIIGILAGLAMPMYTKARDQAFDKEARTSLQLIRAAERIYQADSGSFRNATGDELTSLFNLKLTSTNWDYNVCKANDASVKGFIARASRKIGGTKYWKIDDDVDAAQDVSTSDPCS